MYYITDWPCDMTVWGDIIVILCAEYNLVLLEPEENEIMDCVGQDRLHQKCI